MQQGPPFRGPPNRQGQKWQLLQSLVVRDWDRTVGQDPLVVVDPLIERGGEQLTMFGE